MISDFMINKMRNIEETTYYMMKETSILTRCIDYVINLTNRILFTKVGIVISLNPYNKLSA